MVAPASSNAHDLDREESSDRINILHSERSDCSELDKTRQCDYLGMDVLGLTGLANYLWTFYDPEPLDKKENKTANTRKKEKSTEENRYDQQQKIPSTRSKMDSTPKTSLGVNSCFFMTDQDRGGTSAQAEEEEETERLVGEMLNEVSEKATEREEVRASIRFEKEEERRRIKREMLKVKENEKKASESFKIEGSAYYLMQVLGLGTVDEDEGNEVDGSVFSTQSYDTDHSCSNSTQYRNNRYRMSSSSASTSNSEVNSSINSHNNSNMNSQNNSHNNSHNNSYYYHNSKNSSVDKFPLYNANYFNDVNTAYNSKSYNNIIFHNNNNDNNNNDNRKYDDNNKYDDHNTNHNNDFNTSPNNSVKSTKSVLRTTSEKKKNNFETVEISEISPRIVTDLYLNSSSEKNQNKGLRTKSDDSSHPEILNSTSLLRNKKTELFILSGSDTDSPLHSPLRSGNRISLHSSAPHQNATSPPRSTPNSPLLTVRTLHEMRKKGSEIFERDLQGGLCVIVYLLSREGETKRKHAIIIGEKGSSMVSIEIKSSSRRSSKSGDSMSPTTSSSSSPQPNAKKFKFDLATDVMMVCKGKGKSQGPGETQIPVSVDDNTVLHFTLKGRPELNLEFESESDRDDFLAGFMHLISRYRISTNSKTTVSK